MLDFTQDIKEAGLLFEDHGYHLASAPASFGKRMSYINDIKYSFPADKLLSNMNIAINHYLSHTCALDIDDSVLSQTIFKYLGINFNDLIYNTMCWQGRPNRYKLIYNSPNINLNLCNVNLKGKIILEFKGAVMTDEITTYNKYNYFDHAPPSLHSETKERYKFVSQIMMKNELPNFPDKLLNIWKNWEQEKDNLLKLF